MYLNSVTIIGFVGSDPEQRQSRNNGAKFTVFRVATQRSWKNAQDEWSSKTEWHRIAVFRPRLAEHVLSKRSRRALTSSSKAACQLDLRAAERQRQEDQDHEDHLVVHSRRCRAQARPRRARTGSSCFRLPRFGSSSRTNRRAFLLKSQPTGPRRLAEALFLCWPRLRPNKTNFPPHPPGVAVCGPRARAGFPSTRLRKTTARSRDLRTVESHCTRPPSR